MNGPTYTNAQCPAYDVLKAMLNDAGHGDNHLPPPTPASTPTPGLPASWYRADTETAPDFNWDTLWAAMLGGMTGLAVMLPLLLWRSPAPAAVMIESNEATLVLTAAYGSEDSISMALSPADRMGAMIELAHLRILAGDVIAARKVLSRADVARDANALFLMAETYDPRRIKAWGIRIAPDVARARALYAAAKALGHADAAERLAKLK